MDGWELSRVEEGCYSQLGTNLGCSWDWLTVNYMAARWKFVCQKSEVLELMSSGKE